MKSSRTPLTNLIGYATGGGVFSITINGIAAYAMLYYTQVIGLSAQSVGLALSLSAIWDAVTTPIMGHLTDHSRSRFGSRHPYILLGGIALTILFFFLWYLPPFLAGSRMILLYIIGVNLLMRTAETVFFVPYVALGFEISTDYEERSKLQGIYYFVLQLVNFVCVAVGWSLFFPDRIRDDGSRLDGTKIAGNYLTMSLVLCGVSLALLLTCVWTTRRYARDNRKQTEGPMEGKTLLENIRSIVTDRYAVLVFLFFGIATLAMMLVSQIQMFTYVNFMNFSPSEKTFVHGGGMIAFALGSMLQIPVLRRIDKKPAVYLAMGLSFVGSLMLLLIFIGGVMPVRVDWAIPAGVPWFGLKEIPLSAVVFLAFQGLWWGGIGMLVAPVTSMVADVSEINLLRSNVLKDGSYSAMFGFVQKASCAVGLLVTGWLLDWSGFVSGAGVQTPESVQRVAILTFISGPVILLLAVPALWKYTVDRTFMAKVKAQLRERVSRV
jgi:glycoside/pentoside/hexuronide:cation symporter, GPH family